MASVPLHEIRERDAAAWRSFGYTDRWTQEHADRRELLRLLDATADPETTDEPAPPFPPLSVRALLEQRAAQVAGDAATGGQVAAGMEQTLDVSHVLSNLEGASDFLTEVLALSRLRGVTTVPASGKSLDEAVLAAYETLLHEASRVGVRVGFTVVLDDLHSDGAVVKDAVAGLVARRLLVPADDGARWRLGMSVDLANALLEGTPGGRGLYDAPTTSFLSALGVGGGR